MFGPPARSRCCSIALVKRFGHTICPNLIISENALEWPLHDLYSARELCQMIPITGKNMYRKLTEINEWVKGIICRNAFVDPTVCRCRTCRSKLPHVQSVDGMFLRGNLGSA